MSNAMDGAVNGWLQHRMVLDDLLALVDDAHLHYRPWEGAMSLGELTIHLVTTTHKFMTGIKKGEFDEPPNVGDYQTIDELRTIVQHYTDQTQEEISSIFTWQMKGYVLYGDMRAPGTYWFSHAIDYEVHNKGQLFTYLHLIGVKDLPKFIRRPDEM
ncbi:hypothetical protein GCM10028778_12500 [Barrientosiimonas marina]|uniref:DinB family protein n=1 Tax=Lentibacillus kimchii TaxID=1542911 RepID=A0ABW2UT69_9BACI